MTDDDAHLRVGHAEREAAVARLRAAEVDGRLDHAELDERIGQALTAVTRGDLRRILGDLGGIRFDVATVAPQPPVQRPTGPGWSPNEPLQFEAGMSDVVRVGDWAVPPFLCLVPRVSDVYLNFIGCRTATPVIDVQVKRGVGSITLVLPDAWGADAADVVKGIGDRKVDVRQQALSGGVQVVVWGTLGVGDLKIRTPRPRDERRLSKARDLPGGLLSRG